jgi:hypothetical protein
VFAQQPAERRVFVCGAFKKAKVEKTVTTNTADTADTAIKVNKRTSGVGSVHRFVRNTIDSLVFYFLCK